MYYRTHEPQGCGEWLFVGIVIVVLLVIYAYTHNQWYQEFITTCLKAFKDYTVAQCDVLFNGGRG